MRLTSLASVMAVHIVLLSLWLDGISFGVGRLNYINQPKLKTHVAHDNTPPDLYSTARFW